MDSRVRRSFWLLSGMALVGALGCRENSGSGGPSPSPSNAPLPSSAAPPPSASAAPPAPPSPCPDGMALIPAGKFKMGSTNPYDYRNESPAHDVNVEAFCMDRTEVTVGAYKACVDAKKCEPAPPTMNVRTYTKKDLEFWSDFCNGSREDRLDHPVNCVDWKAADTYCAATGKRLPTEAEWEYAGRGTDGRLFPWGNDDAKMGQLNACGTECVALLKSKGKPYSSMYKDDDGYSSTASVGKFPKGRSPFGVDDMAGNVSEWTSSGHSADYNEKPSMKEIVFRGGSWFDYVPRDERMSLRLHNEPETRLSWLGFRCAAQATLP